MKPQPNPPSQINPPSHNRSALTTSQRRILYSLSSRFQPRESLASRPRPSYAGQTIVADGPTLYRGMSRRYARPANHAAQTFDSVGPTVPMRSLRGGSVSATQPPSSTIVKSAL